TGNFAWPAAGANPVHLGYHWIDVAGNAAVWDGVRSSLAADVAPGTAQTLQAKVQVPVAPGTYTLRWDLVQEGVSWFSGQGVKMSAGSVTVSVPAYGALYTPQIPALAAAAGSAVTIPIAITNTGTLTWDPAQQFALAYHVSGAAGSVTWNGA